MDIVAALRSRAEMSARAMQLMAQSKSERNQAAGDADAHYDGGTKEQTVEWKAADEIERLRAACEASWTLGHKIYHNANAHEAAPDWATVRKMLAESLGKTV